MLTHKSWSSTNGTRPNTHSLAHTHSPSLYLTLSLSHTHTNTHSHKRDQEKTFLWMCKQISTLLSSEIKKRKLVKRVLGQIFSNSLVLKVTFKLISGLISDNCNVELTWTCPLKLIRKIVIFLPINFLSKPIVNVINILYSVFANFLLLQKIHTQAVSRLKLSLTFLYMKCNVKNVKKIL